MTTIAANREMIAADSQGTRDDGPIVSYSDRKLKRFENGDIAGCMGVDDACIEFEEWYEAGCNSETKPSLEEGDLGAIVLTSDGRLFKYWDRLTPVEVFEDYVVLGTGDAVAYGAMDAGATPEQALAIACHRDMHTGPPVVVERRILGMPG